MQTDHGQQLEAALSDALNRAGEGRYADQIRWYAFPQTWGSTSGMSGGPGGQAMTSLQTIAVLTDDTCYVYCAGRFVYQMEPRQAMKCVQELRFPSKAQFEQIA